MAGTTRVPVRRGGLAALSGLLALAVAAGCSGGTPTARVVDGSSSGASQASASHAGPSVVITPVNGAGGVSVLPAAIAVRAQHGTLRTVTLTNVAGRAVAGQLSADQTTWQPTEPLAYGATYTVRATATSADRTAQSSSTFTTVRPGNYTLP